MQQENKPKQWAVVGGGLMGIHLAHSLAKQGQTVTIYESSSELGGLASSWELNGIRWDRHYHVISLTDTRLLSFLKALKLDDKIDWVETRTGFFTDDQMYSMSNSMEFLRFPPLNLIEKLRLGTTIFAASKIRDWKRLEGIPVGDWLRQWSGKGTYEKIWLPLLRAKLGENYDRVSAAFIWATIQRMYKARRTGVKKEMFGCVNGGYETILQTAAQRLKELGVQIRLASAIERIESQDSKLTVHVQGATATEFDSVIMTTPAQLVPRICPQIPADEARKFEQIEYQGIVCASLLLKRSLSPYYVTNITDTSIPLTGIIEMTRVVDPSYFGGNHLIYLPKYVPADSDWLNKTDEQIRDQFLKGLRKVHPNLSEDEIVAFKISRVKRVVALPVLNYSEKLPPIQTSLPNLYAVNSAHIVKGNLNVNETIEISEDAWKQFIEPSLKSDPRVHHHDPATATNPETLSI